LFVPLVSFLAFLYSFYQYASTIYTFYINLNYICLLFLLTIPSNLTILSLVLYLYNVNNKAKAATRKSNTNAITTLILEKHREYQRKEINTLKGSVDKILVLLGNTNTNTNSGDKQGSGGAKKRRASIPIGGGSNNNNSTSSSAINNDSSDTSTKKKQRLIVEEDTSSTPENVREESSQEQIQQQQQQLVRSNSSSSGVSSGGGMLNASLRNRYKDVQREREENEASEKKNDQTVNGDNTEDGKDEGEGKGGKDGGKEEVGKETANALSVGNVASGSTSTSTTAAATNTTSTTTSSTPKKKKKTKKTPSSKSSNNPNNFPLQQQQDGNNPFTTSSSITTLLQPTPRPSERYSNLGGISSLLQQLRELIEYPLSHPELFIHLGVEPPRGVLLRGPPGCGKTHLAKAIAGELNVNYFQVSAPELVGGVSGESEARVRTLFESASNYAPSIIFIDEIDAIAPKRGSSDNGGGKSMEKRIVAQLLTSMDTLHPSKNRNSSAVMVLGATNRPDAMDSALRRAGRFDREIVLGAPDEKAREGILRVMTKEMKVDDNDLNYKLLAKKTPGFVGADVRSLTKEAAVIAINRIFCMDLLSGSGSGASGGSEDKKKKKDDMETNDDKEDVASASGEDAKDTSSTSNNNDIQSITPLTPTQLQPLYVTMQDFLSAIPNVQPSSKREGFATVPDVAWSDIGALANIREELTLSVLEPISHPERFEALGLPLPAGVLLYGPPGCGKTLLAKAIANESGANFISVKGPELLDKYVGESERAVRVVFERARSSSPCIIFFDELDSLCPKRGSDSGGGGGVSERVVNQLLTEMDGLDSRRSVFVIAATNRPEVSIFVCIYGVVILALECHFISHIFVSLLLYRHS